MLIENIINHNPVADELAGLADLLDMLDQIHSAASEDRLTIHTGANRRELVALLREIVFTAQETIHEIEQPAAHIQFCLRILEKPSA